MRFTIGFAGLLIIGAPVMALPPGLTQTTVALTGSSAAGTPAGVTFSTFGNPAINNAGQVVFRANLTGVGVVSTNDAGVWATTTNQSLRLVVRENTQIVNLPSGVKFQAANGPGLDANGRASFEATVFGASVTTSNNEVLFNERSGTFLSSAREGDQAAGLPTGVVYATSIVNPFSSRDGTAVWVTGLGGVGVTSSNNSANYADPAGVTTLVARTGDHAPDTPTGVVFNGLNLPRINDHDHISFRGTLSGTGVTTANDAGVFSTQSGALHLVIRKGDAAPGFSGVTLGNPSGNMINNADHTVFRASLAGAGITSAPTTWRFSAIAAALSHRSFRRVTRCRASGPAWSTAASRIS